MRAIAALIVPGRKPQLVGPCTLVTDGTQVIAFSSAELLQHAPEPLAIALTFDCKKTVPVAAWTLCRTPQMGIIEIDADIPEDQELDVAPLAIGSVSATLDTRNAPSALVSVHSVNGKIARRIIPVRIDLVEGGTAEERVTRATAAVSSDLQAPIDGAALLTWLPPDPLLRRGAEVLVVGLATSWSQEARGQPGLAELHGLEELGRVLPWREVDKQAGAPHRQIAGEIRRTQTLELPIFNVEVKKP